MVRLVSPDRVLHIVPDEHAVRPLVDQLKLEKKKAKALVGNLKQLCGWAKVGDDGRVGRTETDNWQRLESVVWLKHDNGTELVPLVGKVGHMFESVVQPREDMKIEAESLRKLVPSRSGKTFLDVVDGWRRAPMPPEAMQLAHGASLVGLSASPTPAPARTPAVVLPNYASFNLLVHPGAFEPRARARAHLILFRLIKTTYA